MNCFELLHTLAVIKSGQPCVCDTIWESRDSSIHGKEPWDTMEYPSPLHCNQRWNGSLESGQIYKAHVCGSTTWNLISVWFGRGGSENRLLGVSNSVFCSSSWTARSQKKRLDFTWYTANIRLTDFPPCKPAEFVWKTFLENVLRSKNVLVVRILIDHKNYSIKGEYSLEMVVPVATSEEIIWFSFQNYWYIPFCRSMN